MRRLCVAATTFAWIAVACGAEEVPKKIPLAPQTKEQACNPQPSDAEKLRRAVAFFISYRTSSLKAPLGDGHYDASFLESVEAALAAQPDCCRILAFDPEMSRSQEFIDRLGPNFGGFVRLRFAKSLLSGSEAGHTYYDIDYYVLDSCGNPVFKF